ncbi:hypothetical protein FRC05_001092 [Tulasnella sp. 425]|nr:hypothetical protein FRC05_001092 [Tulasnella sp. 425]
MVSTRGKKIEFELDSSEGESVGEKDVQQPVKPAAKRRRTKKSKSEDYDPAFAPSSSLGKGKDKATPDQNMLITRRGGKGGKLRDLMNMPVDIFTEVCSYLDPFDLRRLALTSKRLWDILMTKEARHIWKTALDSVPDLPECPTDLNEPQYVCLLYSSECYTIGCTGRGTRVDWYFRVRFCTACHDANMASEWAVQNDRELGLNVKYNTWQEIRSFCKISSAVSAPRRYRRGGHRGRNEDKHIYVDEVKKLVSQYEALPRAEAQEYLTQLRAKQNYCIETGQAMLRWKSNQLASRAEDIAVEKSARFESIKVKLLDIGWDEKDFPITNKDFRDLVLKDQKLTPKVWQNIKPKLEPLLEATRADRLKRERRQRQDNRENAIRKFYSRIGREAMGLPLDGTLVSSFVPRLQDIFALPSIKPLLEDDTETVTEEQWIEVAPDVRLLVLKCWRDTLKQFTSHLDNGATSSSNEIHKEVEGAASAKTETKAETKTQPGTETDTKTETETEDEILSSIDAMKTKLSYATSVFYCKGGYCQRVRWFPDNIKHVRSSHDRNSLNELLDQQPPLQPEGQELVKRLLKDLGLDPETVKASEIHTEDQKRKTYLCTKCHEKTAKYMSVPELIAHYLNVQKWFGDVTEAVRTQPDSCYPSRAVNSELPKIVNDHDWISSDALLVRQDDEETRKTVLELQKAFRKECLTDPACDTEGIGGEDLEKHSWREVHRLFVWVAMGGIWGRAAATGLESLPAELRGLFSGILQEGYAFSYLIAAVVDLFGVALFQAVLPESQVFLPAREEAKDKGTLLSEKQKTKTVLHEVKVESLPLLAFCGKGKRQRLATIDHQWMLKQEWLLCIYAVLLMAGFNFFSHGSQELYPTYLKTAKGLSNHASAIATIIGNCGAIAGGVATG